MKNEITVTCLNCGHSFPITADDISTDELGPHTSCPECEASFDVDTDYLDLLNNQNPQSICVYKDSTGMFTETECDQDNTVDLQVPATLLFQYYIEEVVEQAATPDEFWYWLAEESTADDTVTLVDWLHRHDFFPRRDDEKFRCDVSEEDRAAIIRGTSYPERHDWGVAGLDIGNVSIELNLTSDESDEDETKLYTEYFLCIKSGDEWYSCGYCDEDSTMVDVDWTNDKLWQEYLRQDMYRVLTDILSGRVKFNGEYHTGAPNDDLCPADFDSPTFPRPAAEPEPVVAKRYYAPEPHKYLTIITDIEGLDMPEPCYGIKSAREIFNRIDWYDCCSEHLDLYLLTKEGPVPCDWHGAWHDFSDPLKFTITLRSTGEVLDTGYGTDH